MTDENLIIWGSGGTLTRIGGICGLDPTLLGIDASIGKIQAGKDLDEEGLLKLLEGHNGGSWYLVSDGRPRVPDWQGEFANITCSFTIGWP